VLKPVVDPFDRRRLEHFVSAARERLDLVRERLDPPLCLDESLASAWLPRPSPMKSTKFAKRRFRLRARLASAWVLREVGAELGDLLFDLTQDVGDVLGSASSGSTASTTTLSASADGAMIDASPQPHHVA
jgi:hypothetical protein